MKSRALQSDIQGRRGIDSFCWVVARSSGPFLERQECCPIRLTRVPLAFKGFGSFSGRSAFGIVRTKPGDSLTPCQGRAGPSLSYSRSEHLMQRGNFGWALAATAALAIGATASARGDDRKPQIPDLKVER